MKLGDQVLFYHSNTKPPGVAGLAVISKEAVPDPSQFDKKSDYYFEKSTKEDPKWFCVQVKFKKKFKNYVSLDEIKETKALKDMLVVKKGQRLSIQPVTKKDFDKICKMGGV
jgi:predicted RNA-binding protein with PUA-like domain